MTGALPADVRVGRRTRALGPRSVEIAAPREVVFEVVSRPYLGRTPRVMRDKLNVLERGSDLVPAEHFTPVAGGRLTAVTVRFTPPGRIDFRLVRGPVPQVAESFVLSPSEAGTRLVYEGLMSADLWRLGQWWAAQVAARWESVVAASLTTIKAEAERRAAAGRQG